MKILRVATDLYPYSIGGLGLHVHELSKEIVKRGHQVTVFTCEKYPKSCHNFMDGYNVYYFKPLIIPFGISVPPSMLPSLFNKVDEFDIVHAHSHLFFSTYMTAFVRKFKKTPLIVTNHGFVSQKLPFTIQKIVLPIVTKWTYLNADAVICYTTEMKEEMENWGVRTENVRIIHNGVNAEFFRPLNNNKKEYDIIWVGRYVPGKGIEFLIQSLSELKKEFNNFKVLMIGSGPLKKSIEKMIIKSNLSNHISLIENISNDDLLYYYNKSKLFVLTSIEEGVPRTILEAMACGLPVVCSDLPQLKTLIEGSGILAPKKDTISIANAVIKILNDNKFYEKLSANARQKIVTKYSWEDTVNKTIQLYEELNK
jgi:glycosyltransferase involved in cell wall biosynthesis